MDERDDKNNARDLLLSSYRTFDWGLVQDFRWSIREGETIRVSDLYIIKKRFETGMFAAPTCQLMGAT